MLTQIAGKLAGVAFRIHTFTGQVWATKTGYKREILKKFDSLIAVSATHLLADSFTQRDFLEELGVVYKNKIQVLGQGSISGINTAKFRPLQTDKLRKELNKNSAKRAFCLILVCFQTSFSNKQAKFSLSFE